jgi:hypothetical protein
VRAFPHYLPAPLASATPHTAANGQGQATLDLRSAAARAYFELSVRRQASSVCKMPAGMRTDSPADSEAQVSEKDTQGGFRFSPMSMTLKRNRNMRTAFRNERAGCDLQCRQISVLHYSVPSRRGAGSALASAVKGDAMDGDAATWAAQAHRWPRQDCHGSVLRYWRCSLDVRSARHLDLEGSS